MGDRASFVAVVIILWTLGLVMVTASIVEFIIWARYGGRAFGGLSREIHASPIVAVVLFFLGAAILLLLYLVATEQVN
jgi:hypothetical protein